MSAGEAAVQTQIINKAIEAIMDDSIQQLHLIADQSKQVKIALASLVDSSHIHALTALQAEDELSNLLGSLKGLTTFQVQKLTEQLVYRWLDQKELFDQAYDIAVLKETGPKYDHLHIEEQVLKITLPIPYSSQPLSEAKFLGQALPYTWQEPEAE